MGVIPDMTTFGKVIGGGMPVGAWGGRADLMDLFDPTDGPVVSHAGTFNANPMTMVAGLATLDQLTPEVYERMNALGDILRAKLTFSLRRARRIAVQVTGSRFAVRHPLYRGADRRSPLGAACRPRDAGEALHRVCSTRAFSCRPRRRGRCARSRPSRKSTLWWTRPGE